MFRSLLVANRGEIACRIFRTARRMGLVTIAVYSEADAQAQHVRQADRAVCIGPPPAAESYLRIDALIEAALTSGAEAVHPGYGFLSENAELAEACAGAGLRFVGPSAGAIRVMGSKIEAKRLVAAAGTPVVPGYQEDDQSDAVLSDAAAEIGFPLLIKASAGGGGKGMRLVKESAEFPSALAGARREARAAFGDDRVLLERYLTSPKHLEVQILADRSGHTLHLFERDCSVQRRHQKVIEEAPAPGVSPELRTLLGEAAVQAAKAIGYEGAGTIEFIAQGDAFYFMEMNTRLQVEHPVTEAVTGLDLVEWQLRIAAGEKLALHQDEVPLQGHAIEARVYAENPRRRFLPSTGRLAHVFFPSDVRVDSGVVTGDLVSVHYDPMLAKVIVHGESRADALTALDRALASSELAGVEHNMGFLRRVLGHEEFRSGAYTTHLVDDAGDQLLPVADPAAAICALLALVRRQVQGGRWALCDGFRVNQPGGFSQILVRDRQPLDLRLFGERAFLGEEEYQLADIRCSADRVADRAADRVAFRLDGRRVSALVKLTPEAVYVMSGGSTEKFLLPEIDVGELASAAGAGERIVSPMPGQVISVLVAVGDSVEAGQQLLVVEAMKMEHGVSAPRAGTVARISCAVGDRVEDGVELVALED